MLAVALAQVAALLLNLLDPKPPTAPRGGVFLLRSTCLTGFTFRAKQRNASPVIQTEAHAMQARAVSRTILWVLFGLYVLIVFLPNLAWWKLAPVDAPFATPMAANLVFLLLAFALTRPVWPGVWLLLPLAVLAPAEVFYTLTYGHPSDVHLLGILRETNLSEAGSYARGLGGLVLLTMLGTLGLGMWLARGLRASGLAWPGRIRLLVLVSGGLAGVLIAAQDLPLGEAEAAGPEPGRQAEMEARLTGGETSGSGRELMNSYPLGLPFRVASYLEQRAGLAEAQARLQDFSFGAHQPAAPAARQVHVLVIGETGRADHWQLNGYARATTPRLARTPGVVNFGDVVSNWAWTRMSVPVMLTRKPGRDRNVFFAERSLISAFREAGFRTYWLSTQSPLGKHDSSIALYADEADETRYLNPARYSGPGVYDGALLEALDAVLARREPRQLIVLHTLGSHFNYADRYPESFDVFRPSFKGRSDASLHDPSNRSELRNSYDNSILYTDHVLAEAIDRLNRLDAHATLLYMADHGENLFDDDCPKSGHGHMTERDFRVASIWWNSASWARARPEPLTRLHSRRNAPLTAEHVFPTLLDAAGIKIDGDDETHSLLAQAWRPRPRWVQGELDFDAAVRDVQCLALVSGAHARRAIK